MDNIELVLIRGIPGSGKTTLARRLFPAYEHFEADDFFMVDGVYVYDASKIAEAHIDCQRRTREAIIQGKSVVVSNTFIRRWEMDYYLSLAVVYGVMRTVLVAGGEYDNTHGVPVGVIKRMKRTFEI